MILELQHRRPDGDIDTYHLKPGRRYHLGRGSACEVRILDLKLSRKHAAIEFQEGEWRLIDLCSTNGCRLNGDTMVGTASLVTGSTIEIGQTGLTIGQLIPQNGDAITPPAPLQAEKPADKSDKSASAGKSNDINYHSDEFNAGAHTPRANKALSPLHPTPAPVPPPSDKRSGSETLRPATAPVFKVADERSSIVAKISSADEELSASKSTTAATLKPQNREPRARRSSESSLGSSANQVKPVTIAAEPRPADLDSTVATLPLPRNPPPVFVQPKMPTPLAAAPSVTPAAIPGSGANSDERSYFITVLGRRLGPLARAVARDLKARELKGTLRPGDLTQYPQA